jgi:GNAT superfamily N-acetyltransferase
MPAMLDDPTAPAIYRTSGDAPYPTPYAPLPANIVPRQVTLRDRSTTATLVPFSSPDQVPKTLLHYLCALLNREIEKGDTYPMINELPLESFGPYWFANFSAVMLLGNVSNVDHVWQMEKEGVDWSKQCLGSFYIKPNYPGRSSHVCNGGFLVSDVARNRGVGRLMGEGYLDWAPQLGYSYSVFNLVYETNIASARIWDALGFKRIGRVPGCGNLKSSDHLVDAIIFGRDLNGEAEDYLSEERFDKIRYYLKTGNYPNGADRAEKSRLRSAGAHYRIVPDPSGGGEEKLMLKDKEVISDPQKQYEIALKSHAATHAGINKTTASIAERYHWIRIKETVSQAIRNCTNCKETAKPAKAPTPGKTSETSQASPGAGADQASILSPATVENAELQNAMQHDHTSAQDQMDISRYDYEDIPVDPAIMTDLYSSAPTAAGTTNDAFSTEATQQEVQGHGGIYGAQIYGDDADAQLQAELASEMITKAAGGE